MALYLILKSEGAFKHSGKYYLVNGRWHKLHADKKAPASSPVSAHPSAAGVFVPKKHYTDEQWEKLKLDSSNTNAAPHNKKIAQIKELSESGDVTGLLGLPIGSNTYGKIHAKIINHHLEQYGVAHKVSAGQKAGEHSAVQAKQDAIDHLESDAKQENLPESEHEEDKATAERLKKEPPAVAVADAKEHLESDIASSEPDSEKEQDKKLVDELSAVEQATLTKEIYNFANKHGIVDGTGFLSCHDAVIKISDAIKTGKIIIPDKTPVKEFYYNEDKANAFFSAVNTVKKPKVTSDVAKFLLEDLSDQSVNGHSFLKIGDKYVDPHLESGGASDAEIQAVGKYMEAVFEKSGIAPEDVKPPRLIIPTKAPAGSHALLDKINWDGLKVPDTNTNAKSHNPVVDKIKKLAYAGDKDAIQKIYDQKKDSKQTYTKKQAKLAETVLAALSEAKPVSARKPVKPDLAVGYVGWVDNIANALDGGDKATIQKELSDLVFAFDDDIPPPDTNAGKAIKYAQDALTYLEGKPSDDLPSQTATTAVTLPTVPDFKTAKEAEEWTESSDFDKWMAAGTAKYGSEKAFTDSPEALAFSDNYEALKATDELADNSPKEGDTKPSADGGVLVFHDGRWHKQKPAVAVTKLTGAVANSISANVKGVAKGNKSLFKGWAKNGEVDELINYYNKANKAKQPNSCKLIEALVKEMTGLDSVPDAPLGVVGTDAAKKPKAAKPKATPAAPPVTPENSILWTW